MQIQEASFRGITFPVNNAEFNVGNRIIVYEYPGSNKVDTEDLGNKVQEIRLEGFYVGTDDDPAIGKLETLREAVLDDSFGTLVFPFGGVYEVDIQELNATHSKDSLYLIVFSIRCVVSGRISHPRKSNNPQVVAETLIPEARKTIEDDFKQGYVADSYNTDMVQTLRDNSIPYNISRSGRVEVYGGGPIQVMGHVMSNIVTALQAATNFVAAFQLPESESQLAAEIEVAASLDATTYSASGAFSALDNVFNPALGAFGVKEYQTIAAYVDVDLTADKATYDSSVLPLGYSFSKWIEFTTRDTIQKYIQRRALIDMLYPLSVKQYSMFPSNKSFLFTDTSYSQYTAQELLALRQFYIDNIRTLFLEATNPDIVNLGADLLKTIDILIPISTTNWDTKTSRGNDTTISFIYWIQGSLKNEFSLYELNKITDPFEMSGDINYDPDN